jgi:hypothetical protein
MAWDLHNNIKRVRSISPVAVGTTGTGQTGKIVDRAGYEAVEFEFDYGSITATNAVFTVVVKEGDVTGTMTSIADADLIGTEAGRRHRRRRDPHLGRVQERLQASRLHRQEALRPGLQAVLDDDGRDPRWRPPCCSAAAARPGRDLTHLAEPLPVLQELAQAAPVLLASVPNEDVFPWRPEYVFHHRHYTPGDFGGCSPKRVSECIADRRSVGPESPVDTADKGRTIAVEARRDDPLASTKANSEPPGREAEQVRAAGLQSRRGAHREPASATSSSSASAPRSSSTWTWSSASAGARPSPIRSGASMPSATSCSAT